jgi:retinol dehydrogenase-12
LSRERSRILWSRKSVECLLFALAERKVGSILLENIGSIRAPAEEFLSKETKLDILFDNAGVWITPQGSKTEQGYELTLGVNDIGPFIFTKSLTLLLVATTKKELSYAVCIV